jgi:hypothetical protein
MVGGRGDGGGGGVHTNIRKETDYLYFVSEFSVMNIKILF